MKTKSDIKQKSNRERIGENRKSIHIYNLIITKSETIKNSHY